MAAEKKDMQEMMGKMKRKISELEVRVMESQRKEAKEVVQVERKLEELKNVRNEFVAIEEQLLVKRGELEDCRRRLA